MCWRGHGRSLSLTRRFFFFFTQSRVNREQFLSGFVNCYNCLLIMQTYANLSSKSKVCKAGRAHFLPAEQPTVRVVNIHEQSGNVGQVNTATCVCCLAGRSRSTRRMHHRTGQTALSFVCFVWPPPVAFPVYFALLLFSFLLGLYE